MNKKLLVMLLALTMMVLCGSMFASSIQSIRIIDANTDGTIDAVDVYLTANIDDNATLGLKADATNSDKATLLAQFAFTSGIVPFSNTSISTGAIANDNILRIDLTPTEGTSYNFSMDYDVDPMVPATKIITGTSDYLLSFSGQIASDRAKPIVKQTTIRDNDNNGRVDEVVIVFTESMNGTITSTSGMSLGGNYDGATLAANGTWSASTTTFTIPITNPNYAGAVAGNTSDPLQLIIFSAVSILDAQGNKPIMGNYHGGITYVDEAKPVLMSSETVRIAETNYVRAYFSEALNNAFLAYTDITLASAPEFTFTTYKYTAGNKYVDFGGTVPNGLVSNTNNQIALSGSGVVADVNGNTSSTTGNVYVVDKIAPWLVAAYTHDINNDGDIDNISIEWSEKIDDSQLSIADFDVAGQTVTAVSTDYWAANVDMGVFNSTANDDYVSLAVAITGTSATPMVSIALGQEAYDINGNATTGITSIASEDKACPVVLTEGYYSNYIENANYILAKFSEDINPESINSTGGDFEYTLNSWATTKTLSHAGIKSYDEQSLLILMTADLLPNYIDPTTSHTRIVSGQVLTDNAGNNTETACEHTLYDKVAPRIVHAYTHDIDNDGKIDRISVAWTEQIDDSSVAADAFTGATFSTDFWNGIKDTAEATFAADDDAYMSFVYTTQLANTSDKPSVVFSASKFSDLNGNANDAITYNTTVDAACPVVISYETKRVYNANKVVVTFSENMNQSTFDPNDFEYTLTGDVPYNPINSISFGVGSLTTLDLLITPEIGNYVDESKTFIQLQNVGLVADNAGNTNETNCKKNVEDKIAPYIVAAYTHDIDNNGTIDRISVEWSEQLEDSSVAADAFTGTTFNTDFWNAATDSGSANSAIEDDAYMSFIYTKPIENTLDTPTVAIAASKVKDLNGNDNNEISVASQDKACIVLLSAETVYNPIDFPNQNAVVATLSEPLGTIGAEFVRYSEDDLTTYPITANNYCHDNKLYGQFDGITVSNYVDSNAEFFINLVNAIHDANGNGNELEYNVAVTDKIAPRIVAAYTHDLDDNGKIDHIDVKWSEAIKDYTAEDFSVADATISSVVTGYWSTVGLTPAIDSDCDGETPFDSPIVATDDEYMSLALTGTNEITGTSATPMVSVQASGEVKDLNDNVNVAATGIVAVDKACPVPLAAWSSEDQVRRYLNVKFSEAFEGNVSGEIAIINTSITLNDVAVTEPFPYDAPSLHDVTTPQLKVNPIPAYFDGTKTNEIVFHIVANHSITTADGHSTEKEYTLSLNNGKLTDKIAPRITEVLTHDLENNGNVDAVTIYFNEPVKNVDKADFVVKNGTDAMLITSLVGDVYDSEHDVANETPALFDNVTGAQSLTLLLSTAEENHPILNTAGKPSVALVANEGSTITDLATVANNSLVGDASLIESANVVDAAKPVVMTAQTARKNNVNYVKATFSEDLLNDTVDFSGITLSFNGTTPTATGVVYNPADHVYEISCLDNGLSLIPTGFSSLQENTTLSVAAQKAGDLNDNFNDARTVSLLDKIGPYLVAAYTHDLDNNGKIDHINLTWSEPMPESQIHVDNFAVAGDTVLSVSSLSWDENNDNLLPSSVLDNDNYTSIAITEDYASDGTPAITVTGVEDELGNTMINDPVTPNDRARPCLIKAETIRVNDQNYVDLTFSEPVTDVSTDLEKYNVVFGEQATNITGTNGNADFTRTVRLASFENSTDNIPTGFASAVISIAANSVADSQENGFEADGAFAISDKIGPYVVNAYTHDLNDDGKVDNISLEWSEAMNASTLTTSNFQFLAVGITAVSTEFWGRENDHLTASRSAENDLFTSITVTGIDNTSLTPVIRFSGITDGLGNAMTQETIQTTDHARPVLLTAEGDDMGAAGLFNTNGESLVLTFSEVINASPSANTLDDDIKLQSEGEANLSNFMGEGVVSAVQIGIANNVMTITKIDDISSINTFNPSYNSDQLIKFTNNTSNIQDGEDNYIELDQVAAVYVTPVSAHILARETVDNNADGYVDAIKISFDRAMDDSTIHAVNWVVENTPELHAGYNFSIVTDLQEGQGVNDDVWYISLTNADTLNTAATPYVAYTKPETDMAAGVTGSRLAGSAAYSVDKAAPVMMSAEWYDTGNVGVINQVRISFSEPVQVREISDYNGFAGLHVYYQDGEYNNQEVTSGLFYGSNSDIYGAYFSNIYTDTSINHISLVYSYMEASDYIFDYASDPNGVRNGSAPLTNIDKAAPIITSITLTNPDRPEYITNMYVHTLPARISTEIRFSEPMPAVEQSGLTFKYYTRNTVEDSARAASLEADGFDPTCIHANYNFKNCDDNENQVTYTILAGYKDAAGNVSDYDYYSHQDAGYQNGYYVSENRYEFNIRANNYEFTDWNYPNTANPKVNQYFAFRIKAIYDDALEYDGKDGQGEHTNYLDYDYDYMTQIQTNYPGIVFTPLIASFTNGLSIVNNCHSTQAHNDIQIQAINSMYYNKGIGQSQNNLSASESEGRGRINNMIITSQNFTVDEIDTVDVQGVQDLLASDVPEDNGGWIQLAYKLSDNDPRSTVHAFPAISYYTIERQGTAADTSWYFIKQIPVGYSRILVEVPSTGIASNYRVNSVYDSQNGTVVPARNASPFSTAGIASSMKDTYVVRMADYENNTNTHRNVVTVTSASVTVAEQDNLPAYATVKVLLEGAYKTQTHTMSRTRALTMASPYGQSETVSAITYVNANNPVIDWVGVQVRNSNNQIVNLSGANAAGFVSRLLLADGSIVNIDGSSTYPMFYTTGKNYSFVIKTRNHLSVMSAQNHTVADLGSCVIDLTTSGSIYGPAHKTIDSKEMLVVGDINASNNVTVQDYLLVKNNLGTAVDNRYDVNYDGNVNTSDYLKVKANLNRLTNIPTATTVRGELLATSSKASKKDVANKGSRTAATVTLVPVTNDGSTFAMDMKVDYSGAPSYVAGIDLYVNYNTDALSNPVFTLNGTEGPAGYSVLSPTVSESDPNFAVCLLDEGPSTDWAMGSSTPGNTLKTIGRITWDVTDNTQNSNVSFSTSFPSDLLNAVGDAYDVIFMDPSTMTLPVELTSFTGCETNGHIELNWTVQSENNLSGYNVYHSTSNDVATRVKVNSGNIQATNAATSHSYNYAISEASGTWYYWLESVEMNGGTTLYGPVAITTSISEVAPAVTALETAYPNPFNPSTTIKYSLKQASDVKIVIYNAKGQLVRTLVNGHKEAGYYNATWIGNDDRGNRVASGIYLYKMITKDYVKVQKMMMIK